MGAGASYFDKGSQLTLTHEQRRRYKQLFEDLTAQGLPTEEVKQAVQVAYQNDRDLAGLGGSVVVGTNVGSTVAVKSARRPSLDKLPVAAAEKNNSGKSANSARNPGSTSVRRRTLESNPSEPTFAKGKDLRKQAEKEGNSARKKKEIDAQTVLLLCSPSDSHILTSQAVSFLNDVKKKLTMDTLETGSSSAAPAFEGERSYYCELCRITCKSAAALEQHIKFSYVHAKAVQEAEEVSDIVERAARLATVLHRCLEIIKFGSRRIQTINTKGKSRAWVRWHWAYRKVRFENSVLNTANKLAHHLAGKKINGNLSSSLSTSVGSTATAVPKPDKRSTHSLLFEGTKFFWKGHETMDMHMFVHNPTQLSDSASSRASSKATHYLTNGATWTVDSILEVVAHDGARHCELERLYIKFADLYHVVEDDIKAELAKLSSEQAKKRKEEQAINNYVGESLTARGKASQKVQPSDSSKSHGHKHHHRVRRDIAYLRAQGELDAAIIADFVLSKLELTNCDNGIQRLVLASSDGIIRGNNTTKSFSAASGVIDNSIVNLLLAPVSIHRRRKSTEAEVTSVINSFRNNAENLKALTKVAGSAVGIHSSPVKKLSKDVTTTRAVESSLTLKLAVLDHPAYIASARAPASGSSDTYDTNYDAPYIVHNEGIVATGSSDENLGTINGSVFADRWDDEPSSGSSSDSDDDDGVEMVE